MGDVEEGEVVGGGLRFGGLEGTRQDLPMEWKWWVKEIETPRLPQRLASATGSG